MGSVTGTRMHRPSTVQMTVWSFTRDSGEAAGEETVPTSSSASTSSCLSEIERRSTLSMLALAPSRLAKLYWEPIGFFTTLMSLAELTCGGGGGGGGGGPGHQFVHPMKRGKRDKQQLAVLTALSQLALCDDEVDVVVVRRQGGLRRQDLV